MRYALMADALLVVHLAFVVFVVAGVALVVRWPRVAWMHLPAVAWGVWIEWSGRLCPLTPLENAWREHAGQAGYAGGFIEHYVWPVLYPAGLTRETALVLGGVLIAINAVGYAFVWRRARARRRAAQGRA